MVFLLRNHLNHCTIHKPPFNVAAKVIMTCENLSVEITFASLLLNFQPFYVPTWNETITFPCKNKYR